MPHDRLLVFRRGFIIFPYGFRGGKRMVAVSHRIQQDVTVCGGIVDFRPSQMGDGLGDGGDMAGVVDQITLDMPTIQHQFKIVNFFQG